jgi:hypothetical protein
LAPSKGTPLPLKVSQAVQLPANQIIGLILASARQKLRRRALRSAQLEAGEISSKEK